MTKRIVAQSIILLVAFLFPHSFFAAATASATTASIQGTLLAEDGSPVKGAKVTANSAAPVKLLQQGPAITGALQGFATTSADGSFQLDKLPAGTYTICAQAAQANQIDPCHWSQTPPQATLAASQNVTGLKITMKKGSILNVAVNDPKHFLLSPSKVSGTPHVLVGVYTSAGQFYPLHQTHKDANSASYSLTIPLNTALRLTVSSKHVTLADAQGKAVPANGLTYAFRHDSSVDNSVPVQFVITGSK